MIEFISVLVVLLLIMAVMSVGVLMGRQPIKGSCGGIGAALGEDEYVCDICGDDPAKCEEISGQDASKLAYDAAADKQG